MKVILLQQGRDYELLNTLKESHMEAVVTQMTKDGGVDIIGNFKDLHFIVQCKSGRQKVGPGELRKLSGMLTKRGADVLGILLSQGGFTANAEKEVSYFNNIIILDDHETISQAIFDYYYLNHLKKKRNQGNNN